MASSALAGVAPAPKQPIETNSYPRPSDGIFEVQLALAHLGISPGSLDGVAGPKTRLALMAFQ